MNGSSQLASGEFPSPASAGASSSDVEWCGWVESAYGGIEAQIRRLDELVRAMLG